MTTSPETVADLIRNALTEARRYRASWRALTCRIRACTLRVRIEYDQPIRSAITVAGIRGSAANNSRIHGSAASATEPAGAH